MTFVAVSRWYFSHWSHFFMNCLTASKDIVDVAFPLRSDFWISAFIIYVYHVSCFYLLHSAEVFLRSRVFLFYTCECQGAEKWCGDFVWKLAYKQKHHTIPHIGEQPNTYKKGLFLVFVYIQVITPGYCAIRQCYFSISTGYWKLKACYWVTADGYPRNAVSRNSKRRINGHETPYRETIFFRIIWQFQ